MCPIRRDVPKGRRPRGGNPSAPLELFLLLLFLGAALLRAFGSVIGSEGHRVSFRRQDRLFRCARKVFLPGPLILRERTCRPPSRRNKRPLSRVYRPHSGNGWGW